MSVEIIKKRTKINVPVSSEIIDWNMLLELREGVGYGLIDWLLPTLKNFIAIAPTTPPIY